MYAFSDVQRVLKEQHQLKKQPFRVLPYYETLQTALYGKDRPPLRLPEAFIEKIDRAVWHHLKENKKSMDYIKQAISSHFCEMDFQKLIQTWRENALSVFLSLTSEFKSTEFCIQKDAWTEIQTEIQKEVVGEAVTLVPNVDEGTITVAENLLLDGGLVKVLSDAAGPKLQNDCNQTVKKRKLTTGDAVLLDAGGRLRCKHVILAIGPNYNINKPQESEKLLKKTVKKSLNLADQESFQSLAIPAIGSGVAGGGFPLDFCADTIVKAIKEDVLERVLFMFVFLQKFQRALRLFHFFVHFEVECRNII
uniref:Poly [ADP-ribose] polymerase 14-like n=1 Tax=Sinocyclocheilus grahami TaxID=75366 RepID=A0A672K4B6_SINGR